MGTQGLVHGREAVSPVSWGYKHGLVVLYLLAGIPLISQGHLTEKLERKRVEPGLQLNTARLVDTGVSLLYLLCLLWSLACEDLVTLLLPLCPISHR